MADAGMRTAWGRIADLPWHAVMVAAYAPLWFVSGNPDLFHLENALRPTLVLLGCIVVIALAALPLYRDVGRAALVASIGVGLMLFYAPVRLYLFNDLSPTLGRGLGIAIVVLAALFVAILIHRFSGASRKAIPAFNLAMLVMIAFPLTTALGNRDETFGDRRPVEGELQGLLDKAAEHRGGAALPSVYHIALDGYSRADVLRDLYGFDNGPFLAVLEDLGFDVPETVTAPYGQTLLTMNAIFSMRYLNDDLAALAAGGEMPRPKQVRQTLHGWIIDSPVRRTFEAAGYGIVGIEGSYPPLTLRPADAILSPRIPLTASTLLGRTVYGMAPFGDLLIHGVFGGRADTQESVRFAFEDRDFRPLREPVFVYNHVLSPHPPFDLDREGGERNTNATGFADGDNWSPGRADRADGYREGYVEKLRYTNAQVLRHVRALQESATGPIVIVLHGDHGGGMYLRHDDFSKTCAKERFSTFLAVYVSDPAMRPNLVEPFNLVNLYRRLFAAIFDADLPMLDDRSYFAPWSRPLQMNEIPGQRRDGYDHNCGDISVVQAETP